MVIIIRKLTGIEETTSRKMETLQYNSTLMLKVLIMFISWSGIECCIGILGIC
jgi:hypothetical protein